MADQIASEVLTTPPTSVQEPPVATLMGAGGSAEVLTIPATPAPPYSVQPPPPTAGPQPGGTAPPIYSSPSAMMMVPQQSPGPITSAPMMMMSAPYGGSPMMPYHQQPPYMAGMHPPPTGMPQQQQQQGPGFDEKMMMMMMMQQQQAMADRSSSERVAMLSTQATAATATTAAASASSNGQAGAGSTVVTTSLVAGVGENAANNKGGPKKQGSLHDAMRVKVDTISTKNGPEWQHKLFARLESSKVLITVARDSDLQEVIEKIEKALNATHLESFNNDSGKGILRSAGLSRVTSCKVRTVTSEGGFQILPDGMLGDLAPKSNEISTECKVDLQYEYLPLKFSLHLKAPDSTYSAAVDGLSVVATADRSATVNTLLANVTTLCQNDVLEQVRDFVKPFQSDLCIQDILGVTTKRLLPGGQEVSGDLLLHEAPGVEQWSAEAVATLEVVLSVAPAPLSLVVSLEVEGYPQLQKGVGDIVITVDRGDTVGTLRDDLKKVLNGETLSRINNQQKALDSLVIKNVTSLLMSGLVIASQAADEDSMMVKTFNGAGLLYTRASAVVSVIPAIVFKPVSVVIEFKASGLGKAFSPGSKEEKRRNLCVSLVKTLGPVNAEISMTDQVADVRHFVNTSTIQNLLNTQTQILTPQSVLAVNSVILSGLHESNTSLSVIPPAAEDGSPGMLAQEILTTRNPPQLICHATLSLGFEEPSSCCIIC